MGDHFEEDRTETHYVLTVGTEVGHYRILEGIGAGGMGEVYLAEDSQLDRKVALKFLPHHLCQDEDCRRRFRREAQSAAGLSHPNIVTIHDVGEFQGRPFIAMEYIEGRSLRDVIRTGELELGTAVSLVAQVCEGLQAAHVAGVVHRDVKPSNILVDSHGRARLIDFGLAAILRDERLTKAGSTLGTVGYMSPEQARGQNVDQRSDVFSVGVVLYEMITGRRPFRGEDEAATLHAITHDIPEPLARYKSKVPDELQRIIGKALEKNPEARYQHLDDLRVDLTRLALEADVTTRSVRPTASRRRLWLYPATAVLLAVIVVLWWVIPLGRSGSASSLKHLVVLPFADLGDLTTTQAIGDGLMETLSSKLTQMEQFHGSLLVVPASEVRENKVSSVRQARKVFGVTHAVTGSVQQHSDRIQITLNLVDTRTERQLHSAIFDEATADISSLVDSSVAELARMLEIQLRPGERKVLSTGGTTSPGAYYSYLRARGHLQRHHYDGNPESIDSAIYCFDDAVKRDPAYALAYAGL
jgi:serine/threonine protein kinase